MNALASLKQAIWDLSLRSLESIFTRGLHTEFRADDVLSNGLPPTVFAIERMYKLETDNVDFLDHLVRAGWSLVSPVPDHDGATALHALVNIASQRYGDDQLFAPIAEYLVNCKQLSELGAPDCTAHDGRTPLHWASSINVWEPAVSSLLKLGADPNATGNNGSTPLHYAAANWHLDRVKQMVQHGADVYVRNHSGKTPVDEAKFALQTTNRGKSSAQAIVDYLTRV